MTQIHSFLWLSNMPLYIYTSTSLSVHLLMGIQVASMSWWLQWTLGYMCLFQLWFSEYMISSGISGLYDSFIPFFFFKGSPYCSPRWFYQFTFPPTVQEGSLFSVSSVAFIICSFFYDGQCDWCEALYFIAVLIITIFWSWEFLVIKFSLIISLWK